jgi:hypothetical protein
VKHCDENRDPKTRQGLILSCILLGFGADRLVIILLVEYNWLFEPQFTKLSGMLGGIWQREGVYPTDR